VIRWALLLWIVISLTALLSGQASSAVATLPNAPDAQLTTPIQSSAPQSTPVAGPSASAGIVRPRIRLTLKQAEALAVRNSPQVASARLLSLASGQVVREARSSYWPTAEANLTAVDSHENSRITAGGLNNPIIFERAAGGVTVRQQLTDFGHTRNLVASALLSSKAEDESAYATRQQVLLATDQAFFGVLQAQAVLRVADQTLASRQVVVDQVQALAHSKLKSDLDLSFAQVNLAQAQLLVLDAQNNEKSAQASLAAILGYVVPQEFDVVDETSAQDPPAGNLDALIQEAVSSRPELQAMNYQQRSAQKLKTAERDAKFPTISALAAAGGAPVRDDRLTSWYGAAGVNLEIPVFNGFLYSAREKEADFRAQAIQQSLIDMRNRIAKDVRTSWLNANTAYSRLDVTNQLLKQANLALDLSQTRYKLGLGSIVELSQAQLQQTQAQISEAQAGYEYRLALAVLIYQTTGL